ncbi:MAG TPA: MCP four helix bundle domain-containing protein, partial [Myxococcota bacterium]|nr:MCP four helix bundle domain-containing protein [Myxococcota bacterium]
MRNNQPVTGQEYVIRDDAAFITHTDAKGRITRANDEFVEASGFTREELMGEPHNIVRHPDMPSEAFRDLWATLKRGRPWTGLVKNRRKNGDHYWVRANVSPTSDGGYTSVRAKPSRQEVSGAEALYARMRANPGIKLEGGHVVQDGLAGLRQRLFGRLRIAHRLWFMTGLSAALFMLAVAVGWVGLSMTQDSLKLIYEGPVKQLEFLGHIKADLLNNQAEILKGFQHDPAGALAAIHDHSLSLHLEQVDKRTGEITGKWRQYMTTPMPPEEKKLAEAFDAGLKSWSDGQRAAVDALKAGNYTATAMAAYLKSTREEGAAAIKAADDLIHFQEGEVKGEYDTAVANYQRDKVLFLIMTVIGLVGVLVAAIAVVAHLSKELRAAGEAADAIASGDLTKPMPRAGEDEIGNLVSKLSVMRNSLHELIASISQNMRALAGSATELSGSAASSARTTEMQAEAASSMAASVEQLSVSIDQVGEHAREARNVTQESSAKSS